MIFGLLILVVLFILVDVVFWFKADLWVVLGWLVMLVCVCFDFLWLLFSTFSIDVLI